MSNVEKINPPKGERVWVSYCRDGLQFFMLTSKINNRDFYFLYEIVDEAPKKLGKAKTPLELEEKFEVNKRLCARSQGQLSHE